MDLAADELARRTGTTLVVRPGGIDIRIQVTALRSADGHEIDGTLTLRVRAADTPADRAVLAQRLLGEGASVTGQMVADRLRDTVTAAAAAAVAGADAAALLAAPPGEALAAAADREAFALGLVVEPRSARLRLSSRSLEQAQKHARALGYLDRAAGILLRFAELRRENPGLSVGALLEMLPPEHRGLAWRDLVQADAAEHGPATVFVVGGDQILSCQAGRQTLIASPPAIAPLRSIGVDPLGAGRLLIGGRGGVAVFDPAAPPAVFESPKTDELGFNSVVRSAPDRVMAAHGTFGLIEWATGGEIVRCLPLPRAHALVIDPEGCCFVADRKTVYRVIDDRIEALATSGSDLLFLGCGDGRLVAVARDGSVLSIAPGRPADRRDMPGGFAVSAAGMWNSVIGNRLLLAGNNAGVDCLDPADRSITRYQNAPPASCRMLAAGRTLLAAVGADRSRIVIWNGWEPQQPARTVHALALLRHRVAGLCVHP